MIKVNIKNLPDSEVEIEGEIASEEFAKLRAAAIATLNAEISIDGFRKGHATEAALMAKVGEEKILLEMAESALQKAYPEIIEQEKLDAIGRPNITITKLAKGNPLGFKIKTAISPKIKLGDYAAAAKRINAEAGEKIEVTDKEVDDLIEEIRKGRAAQANNGTEAGKVKPSAGGDTSPTGQWPELNDDFAKSLGKFENLADLKNKLRENIQHDKELRARDKKRLQIIDEVIKESDIPLPPVLVESELDKMKAEMANEIERMKLKWEDYLTHLKKTEAEIRAGWQDDAKRRVRTGLVLNEIATKEKIVAPEEEIKKELDHLKQHYPARNAAASSEAGGPNTDEERLRQYVANLIVNEKVFEWLEGQK